MSFVIILVIILVIKQIERTRHFVCHLSGYSPDWSTLSPITVMYHYSLTEYFKHPTDTMKTLACTARHLPPI